MVGSCGVTVIVRLDGARFKGSLKGTFKGSWFKGSLMRVGLV